jgi:large subunit ribosomal protein L5e
MVFVKVVKNRSYFSRYQVKWRRRREGKTNYKRRRALVAQDKNKYNTPKWRLVIRRSNRDITAQIVTSKIQGDIVHASAYSHELAIHGAPVGLSNYAAAYATGLLLARRMLTKIGLADKYEGAKEVSGADFNVTPADGARRPFKAIVDAGLTRTMTGARLFGVLKGALDGGIDIPHSEKRFPGFSKEKGELDSEAHRKRIFAIHVAEFQQQLQSEDPEKYKTAFSNYIKYDIAPDKIQQMWADCHASIRKHPNAKRFDETFVC